MRISDWSSDVCSSDLRQTVVFMTTSKDRHIEVLGQERRRRWSVEEKLTMVRESLEPGHSVSVVARRHGINPNQLFHWRKLYQDGSLSAVSAGEAVVPADRKSVV